MNLCIIDTKTCFYSVYKGKEKIQSNQFSRVLYQDETEAYRKDPAAFVATVGYTEEPTPDLAA